MPPHRASQIRPGRRLGEQDFNQLLQEAERQLLPAPDSGIASSNVGSMSHAQLLPEIMDPANVRQGFLGMIVPAGPDGEDDHEGALYWVREMVETTPLESPQDTWPTFGILDDSYVEEYGPEFEETIGISPARWVTAVNFGEYNPHGPQLESHALAFGPTPLVRVSMMESTQDVVRWYFDRAAGGTQLGVVRSIPSDGSPTVGVQVVQKNPETGVREFVGDVVQIACWAGLFGRHYRRHLWPIIAPPREDPVRAETKILQVTFVDSEWQVQQTMRYSFPTPPPDKEEPPISDCQVVRPV